MKQLLKIAFILSFVLIAGWQSGLAQNQEVSLGIVPSCYGDSVSVPLSLAGFSQVGAITFYIGYDTAALDYSGFSMLSSDLPGFLINDIVDSVNRPIGKIGMSWSGLNYPDFIQTEVVLDLHFTFTGDTCILSILPESEIANSNAEVEIFQPLDGMIFTESFPEIIAAPGSLVILQAGVNTLSVTAIGAQEYQWQYNAGSGWENIQESAVFSGTQSASLQIANPDLSIESYQFRCKIKGCGWIYTSVISVELMLSSLDPEPDSFKIFPNPSSGEIFIQSGKSIHEQYTFDLYSTSGTKIMGSTLLKSSQSVYIMQSGVFLLCLKNQNKKSNIRCEKLFINR